VEDPQVPEELARFYEQLWQTVLQVGSFSALQERNRIARDLHDSLGQALTALNIQLQTAVKLRQLDPGRAEEFLEGAQHLAATAIEETRQTVKTLRADISDGQSIDTLISSLVGSFYRSTDVLPSVDIDLVEPLLPEVVDHVRRIIQEALNNICKYAQATEVQIHLSSTPTSLTLRIRDNGRGFNLKETTQGFGLQGMRERVSLMRGQFQVITEPGAGCCIQINMPLRGLSLKELKQQPPAQPVEQEGNDTSVELKRDQLNQVEPQASEVNVQSQIILSPAQYNHLTQILLAWVGPIAPILVQTAIAQAQTCNDFVEKLSVNVAPHHRAELERHIQTLCQSSERPRNSEISPSLTGISSCFPTESSSNNESSNTTLQPLNQDMVAYCEHELAAIIGPIAHLLVQDALSTCPDRSLDELLDHLVKKIPNPQKAEQFKQHIFSRRL